MRPIVVTRAGVVGTVLVLVVAAVCVRLGFWQLDRRAQRLALNAVIAARGAEPALVLSSAPWDTAGLLYRAVELRGEYDDAHAIVLAGRSHAGSPGVHVLTPLKLASGGAILVDRGWVRSPDARTVDLAPLARPGTIQLRGVVLPFPAVKARVAAATDTAAAAGADRVVHRLDYDRIRRQLPYAVPAAYVQAVPEADAPASPLRLPPPQPGAGPHLSYAVQWFAFAAVALIGWLALVLRRGWPGKRGAGD